MISKLLAVLIILTAGSCDLCDGGTGETRLEAPPVSQELTLGD